MFFRDGGLQPCYMTCLPQVINNLIIRLYLISLLQRLSLNFFFITDNLIESFLSYIFLGPHLYPCTNKIKNPVPVGLWWSSGLERYSLDRGWWGRGFETRSWLILLQFGSSGKTIRYDRDLFRKNYTMQATSISSSKADYIDIYLSRLVKLTHPKEQRSASNNRLHIRGGAI